MKTYTKTIQETRPQLAIRNDENATSPRVFGCNLGYFITVERNYNSPDEHSYLHDIIKMIGEQATNQKEHIDLIKDEFEGDGSNGEKILAIYPIVKYEHGSVSYSLGAKHGFDYSNNSFYIITDKTQKAVGTSKKDFEEVIKAELEVYNKWANGEVYSYCLYDKDGEVIDSCGGFYSLDDIKGYLPKEWKKEDLTEYVKN